MSPYMEFYYVIIYFFSFENWIDFNILIINYLSNY